MRDKRKCQDLLDEAFAHMVNPIWLELPDNQKKEFILLVVRLWGDYKKAR
jgi:hypothetical protein